jgi:hypothetical protein
MYEKILLKWKALAVGMQKINLDATVDTTNGRSGIGIIERDHECHSLNPIHQI